MVLDDIATKVAEGYALTAADAEALASTYDIVSLGMVADDVRRATHGTRTTFLRVAHLPAAWLDGQVAWSSSAREARIDAPFVDIDHARAAVRGAAAAADGVAISGFSLADIEQAAAGEIARARTWFDALHDAGLATIDEAPVDGLREPAALLQAAEAAGVPVARLTVHRGSPEGPLPLIRLVAALQAETNAVRTSRPWPSRGFCCRPSPISRPIGRSTDPSSRRWPSRLALTTWTTCRRSTRSPRGAGARRSKRFAATFGRPASKPWSAIPVS